MIWLSLFDISLTDVLTVVSVTGAAICYIKDKRRENKYATMAAYQALQREVFSELNRWRPAEIKEAVQDNQSDAYKKLEECLSRIELFCAGINQRIYDFETFYAIAHGYFDQGGKLYNRLIPLIEKKLNGADEDYFHNIHKVWKRMELKKHR